MAECFFICLIYSFCALHISLFQFCFSLFQRPRDTGLSHCLWGFTFALHWRCSAASCQFLESFRWSTFSSPSLLRSSFAGVCGVCVTDLQNNALILWSFKVRLKAWSFRTSRTSAELLLCFECLTKSFGVALLVFKTGRRKSEKVVF